MSEIDNYQISESIFVNASTERPILYLDYLQAVTHENLYYVLSIHSYVYFVLKPC